MANLTTEQSCGGRHRAPRVSGYGRYVGRVGALAVALGIGMAVSGGVGAGVAFADDVAGAEPSNSVDKNQDSDPAPEPQDDPPADEEQDLQDPVEDDDPDDGHDDKDDEEPVEEEVDEDEPIDRSSAFEKAVLQQETDVDPVAVVAESEVDPAAELEVGTVTVADLHPTPEVVPVAAEVPLAASIADAPVLPAETPSEPGNALAAVVENLLSPLVSPDPSGPSESPLAWAALAFARRQVAGEVESGAAVTAARSLSTSAPLAVTAAAPVVPTAAPIPNFFDVIGTVVRGIVSQIGNVINTVIGGLLAGVQRFIAGIFNTPPVAAVDSYSTAEGVLLITTGATGVLANDTDANSNALTAQLVSGPSHGVLALNDDGSFTYTPETGFSGADTFTYRAADGFAASNTATVSLTVVATPVNTPPVSAGDTYGTVEATDLVIPVASGVLANDTDSSPLTAQLVSGPSHGSLTFNADGSFSYTPDANFSGADFFSYRASDGTLTGEAATVRIDVTLLDGEPPVIEAGEPNQDSGAVAGKVTVESRTGNPVTYSLAEPLDPAIGTVVVDAATGAWTFTPNPQARLDAAAAPVAARMVALAAPGDDTALFVINATDGVNTVSVPIEAPIAPAQALITDTIELGTPGRTLLVHGDLLYVTVSGKVVVINRTTNTIVDEIETGGTPTGMAVVGDRLYITNTAASPEPGSVWVVDLANNTLVDLDPSTATIDAIPAGKEPQGMAVVGTRLYVANINDGTATVIDTTTNTVVDTIQIGLAPFGLATDGERLFIVNLVFGTVTVIDTDDNTMVDTNPATPGVDPIAIRTGGYLPALALDGGLLYVTDLGDNKLVVVDTTTYTVVDRIDVGSAPAAVAVSGSRVYVANAGDGRVAVVDPATNTVVATFVVGANPNAIVASGNNAYVVNATSNSVSVITSRAQPIV